MRSSDIDMNTYLYELQMPSSLKNMSVKSLAKVTKAYKKNLKTIDKFLSDHGENISEVKKDAVKLGLKYKAKLSNPTQDPKKVAKFLQDDIKLILTKNLNQVKTAVKNKYDESYFGDYVDQQIQDNTIMRYVMFVIVFKLILLVNTTALLILMPLVGNVTAFVLMGTFLAPIVEEFGKRAFIKLGYGLEYTGVFAGLEMIQYVIRMVISGSTFQQAIIVRLMAVMLHMSTAMVQKLFHDESKDLKSVAKAKVMSQVGFVLAVLMHMTWNFIAFLPQWKELLNF